MPRQENQCAIRRGRVNPDAYFVAVVLSAFFTTA